MFELTLIYKMPNGRHAVSIITSLNFDNLVKIAADESWKVGMAKFISLSIRPVSIG